MSLGVVTFTFPFRLHSQKIGKEPKLLLNVKLMEVPGEGCQDELRHDVTHIFERIVHSPADLPLFCNVIRDGKCSNPIHLGKLFFGLSKVIQIVDELRLHVIQPSFPFCFHKENIYHEENNFNFRVRC
ncbi:MAG: hypothetical protein DRP32_06080 [Thermotogae bacterium]|nr:MAG: hypothetical protein DRP32_06080 [Thermotogota bacterium]